MSDLAIRVQGLGKQYYLGGTRERYATLRDEIRKWTSLRTLLRRGQRAESRPSFWALMDVSFEVKRGEVVGIIGRNGAGKSTLLKILSRITEPTEGAVDIRGRVGSLLEVGTGFHPELTGRENVFLNGAILGMRRAEILRKFDDIVAFAEVEKFIDTPVKHYSSGMYMRLAFAVAAHLEPEILVVDEVLAVGDAQFQKKCLGKMGEVAREGRTILFVSHNMAATSHLCSSGILLESGKVWMHGAIQSCIEAYLAESTAPSELRPGLLYSRPAVSKNDAVEALITAVEVLTPFGTPATSVHTWDDLMLRVHYHVARPVRNGHVIIEIYDQHDRRLLLFYTHTHYKDRPVCQEPGYANCHIQRLPLAAGTYHVGAGILVPDRRVVWHDNRLGLLTVHPADIYECGWAPAFPQVTFAVPHQWEVVRANSPASVGP